MGGGIGGLTLTRALALRGIHAEIYEAASEIRPLGGGLIVPPNSARILQRLGVGEIFRSGLPLRAMQIVDASGQVLYRRDQGAVQATHGFGLSSISRPKLYEALTHLIPRQDLHTGYRLNNLGNHGEKSYAVFTSGRHIPGELIVGADGAGSATRKLLFPDMHLHPTGQVALRGLLTFELPPAYAQTFTEFWGAGRRLTMFPLAGGQVYWHAVYNDPHDMTDPTPRRLADAYADFPAPVQSVLRQTPPEQLTRTPLYDLPPLPHWSRGNVTLLGDAAHATSPNLAQGAAQAIEDADALAEALASGKPLAQALASYQRRREGQANAAVARSRQMGQIGQVGGALRWVRNAALKMNPDLARKRIEAFYGEQGG